MGPLYWWNVCDIRDSLNYVPWLWMKQCINVRYPLPSCRSTSWWSRPICFYFICTVRLVNEMQKRTKETAQLGLRRIRAVILVSLKARKKSFSLIWEQKTKGPSASCSMSKMSRKVCLFLEVLSYFCVGGNSFLLWVCSGRPASIHKAYKPSERRPQQRPRRSFWE